MNDIIIIIIMSLSAYVAGSVNFSIILFKLLGKEDPRNSHSGNAGTTNVYRQAGLFWAIVVLLLDVGRSIAVAFCAMKFMRIEFIPWIAFMLLLGNRFPCFHNFKGGKGVANYLGFVIIISPYASLLSALNWVIVYFIIKISFVASFFMVFFLSVGMALACGLNFISVSGAVVCFGFVVYNHRGNFNEVVGS